MRGAIVGLLLFPNVMIVHFSVDWWRSLHQTATITRLDPTIEGTMLFTLMLGIVVFGLLFALAARPPLPGRLAGGAGRRRGLDEAIAERRAEAGVMVDRRDRDDPRRLRRRSAGASPSPCWPATPLRTVRRGRSLAERVPPEERRWS